MYTTKTFTKFFTQKLAIKFVIPILILMLFTPTVISSFNAYGLNPGQIQGGVDTNDCFAPLTTVLGSNYQGPVVVDSYWVDSGTSATDINTNNPVKKEIGPGEGPSVFAVVLNSRSTLPILSVTGFLNLPSGITPLGIQNQQLLQQSNQASRAVGQSSGQNTAVANYNGIVQPGSTLILYFNLNVLPNAKVGTYTTTLVANYNIQGSVSQQCTSALLNVPFILPGKVILDAANMTPQIPPQTQSPVSIAIENKGSVDATGVVATITNLGSSKGASGSSNGGGITLSSSTTQLVNLGANTFNIGTIAAKSRAVITTTVYPSSATSGSTQEIQLQIDYQNAWGKLSSANISTGLVISPNPPQSISLSYLGNTTTPEIIAGNLDNLNFAVANNSTDPMSNIILSLVPQSTSVSIVGPSTWTIPNMQPGDRQVLATKVFAASSLINTPTSFTLTANYISKGQSQTNSLTLGAFVIGSIKLQIYGLSSNSVGGISNLVGNLLNQGSTTALFTTIQLAPSPLLDAMRSARLANSTNNQSNSFTASTQSGQGFQASGQEPSGQGFQGGGQGRTGQGFQAGGQGRTGQGFQGGGGGQRGSIFAQQFIGDLSPDSPIPISVPIGGLSSLPSGPYQVAFRVIYADDLKDSHTVILNGTVFVAKSPQPTTLQHTSILDKIPLPIIIGTPIVVVVVIAYIIKKKRSTKKKLKSLTQGDTDIVSIFDDAKKKENES